MQQLKYELIHGDTITHLSQIDKMVDVIFADPPYFLSNGGVPRINPLGISSTDL